MKQNELAKIIKIIYRINLYNSCDLWICNCAKISKRYIYINSTISPIILSIYNIYMDYNNSFYAALFEGWKISNEINKDNSFSKKNIDSLNRIRRYALCECFLYFVGALILLYFNLLHLSILIIILFVIFIAMCISVFTAVLAHLVQKACDLKDENDLTI